jgi:DNA-binding SARP family transcriptional activator
VPHVRPAIRLLRQIWRFLPSAHAGVVVTRPAAPATRTRVTLLDGFALHDSGRLVPLPLSAQRVLAFVALQDHAVPRNYAASTLWVDATEQHAVGSLRTALWRLRHQGYRLVEADGSRLRIAGDVAVDAHDAAAWARRVLEDSTTGSTGGLPPLLGVLLPDWYDDWVLLERDRLCELRAHALESLCARLTTSGHFGEAMEAAQAALKLDTLRDSAHRHLIRVHLAEGNQAEALGHYFFYRQLLRDQLSLEPSKQMQTLVRPLIVRNARSHRHAWRSDEISSGRAK